MYELLNMMEWIPLKLSDDIIYENADIDNSAFTCIKASGLVNTSPKKACDYVWDFLRSID